jgi:hypothetical protein
MGSLGFISTRTEDAGDSNTRRHGLISFKDLLSPRNAILECAMDVVRNDDCILYLFYLLRSRVGLI